jgi:hypothetical protein
MLTFRFLRTSVVLPSPALPGSCSLRLSQQLRELSGVTVSLIYISMPSLVSEPMKYCGLASAPRLTYSVA